jgi:hypothetical protein
MPIDELEATVRELAGDQGVGVTDFLKKAAQRVGLSLGCLRQFLGFGSKLFAVTRRSSLIRSRIRSASTARSGSKGRKHDLNKTMFLNGDFTVGIMR